MFGGYGNFDSWVKKKAAIYIRVSTLGQVEEGYGLDVQLEMCNKMCEIKNFDIHDVYKDEGISGTKKPYERPGMIKLIEDAKKKLFEVLVFYCFDRLGREIRVTLSVIDALKELDIEIISCMESIDTSTDQGNFMLNIYASVSDLELRNIKSRLLAGRTIKKEKNGDIGGRIPYGYSRIDNSIEINPDEALIVEAIFDAYYVRKLSMNKIANALTKEGIKTARGNEKWYASSIKSIIDNKDKYEGWLINNNSNGICWPIILKCKYEGKKMLNSINRN